MFWEWFDIHWNRLSLGGSGEFEPTLNGLDYSVPVHWIKSGQAMTLFSSRGAFWCWNMNVRIWRLFEYFSWEIWCENMIKKVLKANPDIQLITFNHAQLRWQYIFWGVFEILVSKTIVKDRSHKDHCKGLCLVFVCPLSNSLLSKDSSMKRPDLWREKCVPTKLIPMKGKMGKIGEKVSKNGKGGGWGPSTRFEWKMFRQKKTFLGRFRFLLYFLSFFTWGMEMEMRAMGGRLGLRRREGTWIEMRAMAEIEIEIDRTKIKEGKCQILKRKSCIPK